MENAEDQFFAAIKDAFKRFSDFSGVSTRSQFWYYILGNAIASTIASIIAGNNGENLISLITLIPTIAVSVRRMHDVGKSGWFILVPVYNIVLFATPSKYSLPSNT
jgi:uncharacterized membrane protein YhaH (DUF805 family)